MVTTWTSDFELIIGETPTPGTPPTRTHPVQVTSPNGPGCAVIDFDLADPELKNLFSAGAAEGPTLDLRKRAGKALFDRLFQGEILTQWTGSIARRAAGEFNVLRIRLWFRDPSLAALPWELLYTGNHFLATDAACTLSRYLAGPEPSYLAPVEKLRVLAIVSSPANGVFKIPDEAVTGFKAMFDTLAPAVEYALLVNPDLAEVQAKLADRYHVLHYLGHGAPNELLFTRPDGTARRIAVENLRQLAVGRRELRVVVLNACGSAQASDFDVFAGVGPGFVQIGVPAVVAMQYGHVDLEVARKFNATFYPRLATGAPVDVAVSEGRQAISAEELGDRGWSTPVLYLGTRGGRIIELAKDPGAAADDPWVQLRQAIGEVEFARHALGRLADEFREVAKRLRQLEATASVNDEFRTLCVSLEPLFKYGGAQGATLANDGFAVVQGVWQAVLRNSLVQFQQRVAGAELNPLGAPLTASTLALQQAIDDAAMKRIPPAINELHAALDQTDIALRGQIRELVRAISDAMRETLARV